MIRLTRVIVLLTLLGSGVFVGRVSAQTGAAERAATLRAQLIEIQTRQSELQIRLQQVEESMKPEVIEHSLAGFGSTHPEELREQRRRQLEIELNGTRAQLDQLSISRTRVERSLAEADAQAYHESAGIGVGATPQQGSTPPARVQSSAQSSTQSSKQSLTRTTTRKKISSRKQHRRT